MIAHGSAFPVAKLALNNSVPPILMASLRIGLVFLLLIPFWKFRLPNKKLIERLKTRNIKLFKTLKKKGINNKFTEELKLSIDNNYVEKFWIGFKG